MSEREGFRMTLGFGSQQLGSQGAFWEEGIGVDKEGGVAGGEKGRCCFAQPSSQSCCVR